MRGVRRGRHRVRADAPLLEVLTIDRAATLELSAVPIVDQHCHSLLRRLRVSVADYVALFTEASDARHAADTIFFRWALKEIAAFLACDPTVEAVVAARAAVPAAKFFQDAEVRTLVVDHGYRTDDTLAPTELGGRVPARIATLLRLETLAQDLIVTHATFDDVVGAFASAVEGARAAGHVGLKSIVAYRTGLAVRDTTAADASAAFVAVKDRARRDGRVRLATKPLNDFLVLRALDIAEREALPVQFHTGFGDPDVDLLTANPLHLRAVIERYRRVPFVLLHASYPYVRELGYLAAVYPNVFADIGLAIPHVAAEIPAVLRQLLGLAPTSKVLYSSDASAVPELFWIAARWARRGLRLVLSELVDTGALTFDEAMAIAEAVLGGNAAALYGL